MDFPHVLIDSFPVKPPFFTGKIASWLRSWMVLRRGSRTQPPGIRSGNATILFKECMRIMSRVNIYIYIHTLYILVYIHVDYGMYNII